MRTTHILQFYFEQTAIKEFKKKVKAQHIQFYNCDTRITKLRLVRLDIYCVPGKEEQ